MNVMVRRLSLRFGTRPDKNATERCRFTPFALLSPQKALDRVCSKILKFYNSRTTSFYRDTDAVILVYDMTDPASFSGLDRWKEELEANVPFSQKILVGNKVDLEEHGRQVTLEEGQNWATKHGFLFMEASAKTNANVQELFAAVVDAVLLQGTGRSSIGRKKSVAVSLRKSTGSSNSRRNRFSSACRLL